MTVLATLCTCKCFIIVQGDACDRREDVVGHVPLEMMTNDNVGCVGRHIDLPDCDEAFMKLSSSRQICLARLRDRVRRKKHDRTWSRI
jgi:hypothetical protein